MLWAKGVQAAAAILDAVVDRHHVVDMRTTLILDPDVVRLVQEAAHRQRRSIREVINDALRRVLIPGGNARKEPYRMGQYESQLRAGFSLAGFNHLADELEDDALIDKVR